MLTATRRKFLMGVGIALVTSGCGRVQSRPTPPSAPTSTPEFEAWRNEALAMLSDGLETLRTFEVYAAFRVSSAAESDLRLPASLAWDPPTSADWDSATHVSRALYGRADQLFQAVTTANVDTTLWRERRSLAESTYELLTLGDALSAYRNRVDRLPLRDGATALPLLDKAWAQWESAAARFGVSRSEPIPCG